MPRDLDRLSIPPVTIGLETTTPLRFRFWVYAIIFALTSKGVAGPADQGPAVYFVVTRDEEGGQELHREGPFPEGIARETLHNSANQINKIGLAGFLYRKQHGWRLDDE
jgi:hypothetical protein